MCNIVSKTFNDIVFLSAFLSYSRLKMNVVFPELFHQFCFGEGFSQPKQMKAFKHIPISSIDFKMLTS